MTILVFVFGDNSAQAKLEQNYPHPNILDSVIPTECNDEESLFYINKRVSFRLKYQK
jgi:hypothetical protein